MAGNDSFELPLPHEKSASKFILDALNSARGSLPNDPESGGEPEVGTEAGAEAFPNPAEPRLALPEGKQYFRVGEAAALLEVEPHVLRYWESEFQGIRPLKSRSGQRTYTRRDVERFVEIRHLLYVEKFSVKGAKQKLKESKARAKEGAASNERHRQSLKQVAQELRALIQLARCAPGTP